MTESMDDLLETMLKNLGISKKIKKTQILNTWPKVIGEEIKEHTEAKFFDKGTLFVNVDNSSWAHQLLFMKQDLINKINGKINEELVTEIRFKVGHISDDNYDFFDHSEIEEKKESLNQSEKKEIEQTADYINDDKLREKFSNLLTESKKINKWRIQNDWHECPKCEVLIPDFKDKCSICELKEDNEKLVERIEQSLYTTPWLSYEKLAAKFPQLKQRNFDTIKDNLAQRLENKLDEMMVLALQGEIDKQKLRVLVQNYVMLETGVNPENLNDRLIERIIGSNKMKIYNRL